MDKSWTYHHLDISSSGPIIIWTYSHLDLSSSGLIIIWTYHTKESQKIYKRYTTLTFYLKSKK